MSERIDVQVENGFTRIANQLLTAIAAAPWDAPSQPSVILALIRVTYGFHRTAAPVATSTWAELAGISRSQLIRTRNTLEKEGVIRCTKEREGQHGPMTWELQKDPSRWGRYRVKKSRLLGIEALVSTTLPARRGVTDDTPDPDTQVVGAPRPYGPRGVTYDTPESAGAPTKGLHDTSESDSQPVARPEVTPPRGSTYDTSADPVESRGSTYDTPRGSMHDTSDRPKTRVVAPRIDPLKIGKDIYGYLSTTADRDPGLRETPAAGRSVDERTDPPREAPRTELGDGPIRELHPESITSLVGLTHHSLRSTVRSLEARWLYDDDETLADPSVKGLPYDRRLELVGAALLELGAKSSRWDPRHFAGFVRRLRSTAPPEPRGRRSPRPGPDIGANQGRYIIEEV